MNESPSVPQAQVPPKRPIPSPIDPKKFVGGENIEKLKSLLKDVDEFASTVKSKGEQLTKTLDLFHSVVVRMGEVVERFDKVVGKMEGQNGRS